MPKHSKRTPLKLAALAALMAAFPQVVGAAGLGKITVHSALGQPLRAELEVTASSDEIPSLTARVAPAEAFRQAGIEYSPVLGSLNFSRNLKERNGRRYIELTTDRPLNEPFVDMLVELSWASGRLVREYTFLLDPPELAPKATPVPLAAPVAAAPAPAAPAIAAEKPVESRSAGDTRPVTRPAPAPAQPVAAKPSGDATRKVVSGDTLAKIAAETRSEGVSLDQMLVALFQSNREAFDGDNMNRLRAGKILTIPDAESASRLSADEARKEVRAQAVDFNAYRRRLAEAAAAAPAATPETRQEASGKIAPRVEDKTPAPKAGGDKLEVSRTEAAKDKQLQGRVATLEEDLVAREKALREANSRIADLEKNLGELKKLAELKSKAGADLQQQAKAATGAAPKPAEPTPVKPEAAKPAEAPKTEEAAKPAAAAQPAAGTATEAKTEAAAPEAPQPPPPPKKKKPAPPPPPPPPEPDFMEEHGPLVLGGGGILALLLGWLGFSAYRRKKAKAAAPESVPIAESDLSANSVFSATVAPPPSEQEPSQFSETAIDLSAPQDTVDPVVEADTFLAFGRDAQAEEILLDALKSDPSRLAVHLKLLDIYAGRKNVGQFEAIARGLHDQTGGSGPDWERAAALGATLDPANPLYGAVAAEAPPQEEPAAAPSGNDMGATMVLAASPLAAVTAAEAVPPAGAADAAPGEAEPEAVAALDTGTLDFDLDLGTDAATAQEAAPPEAEAAVASNEVAALDFDLDLGSEAPAAAAAVAEPAPMPADVALDIDFDLPAPAATAEAAPIALDMPLAEEAPAPVQPAGDGGIDFEFDLGDKTPAVEVPAEPVAEAAPPALDLGSISLDLDVPLEAPASEPAPALEMPATDAVADNPEVATKLELAMAYEEMGDKDGARELYQEALAEGSPAQQETARAKLAGLG